MKLRFLLPVLAMSVLMHDVSAQEARTDAAPLSPPRDARPNTAPAPEQVQRTRVVDGATTNAQPMSLQGRRSGRATWAVDAQPAAILANIAADGFSVTSPNNSKETLSLISSVPSLLIGGDIACYDGYLNLRLGGGMLLNSSLGTWFATGQAGFSLEVQRNVMFGPHIGLSYYAAPEWWGDTDITFDDTMGFLLGLHIAAGDRISYLLSIDYMSISFDVDAKGPGVNVSNNKHELDMSGLSVQFGLRVQF